MSASLWTPGAESTYLPPPGTREFHALAYGAAGAVEVSVGCHYNFYLTLTQATSLSNPTGEYRSGDILQFVFTQDATGGRVMTFGNKFYFAAKTAPAFVTTANARNYMCATYFDPADVWICSWLPNVGVPV